MSSEPFGNRNCTNEPSYDEVLKGFSTRVRSTIKKAVGCEGLHFAPVTDSSYANRIQRLHTLPFERTGGAAPPIDVRGILRDCAGGASILIGAFVSETQPPEDLVGILWGRLHGDHAVVEINGSEKSALLSRVSPGFGLMAHLIDWATQHNARWLDLGGLACLHPAADDPLRGVIEFKTRFSSDFREVAEEWSFAPTPLLAAAAAAVRSITNQ